MKLEKRTITLDYADGRPGAYRLARDLVVDGHPYGLEVECTNPAYGDMILDQQERDLLERIAAAQPKPSKQKAA